jgi:hypothetical protein
MEKKAMETYLLWAVGTFISRSCRLFSFDQLREYGKQAKTIRKRTIVETIALRCGQPTCPYMRL